jgi:hypothetical protein
MPLALELPDKELFPEAELMPDGVFKADSLKAALSDRIDDVGLVLCCPDVDTSGLFDASKEILGMTVLVYNAELV